MLISRLSASAALFAVLATATFAIAAERSAATQGAVDANVTQAPVVQLERVVVTARRLPAESR
jgi:hypothetical protein